MHISFYVLMLFKRYYCFNDHPTLKLYLVRKSVESWLKVGLTRTIADSSSSSECMCVCVCASTAPHRPDGVECTDAAAPVLIPWFRRLCSLHVVVEGRGMPPTTHTHTLPAYRPTDLPRYLFTNIPVITPLRCSPKIHLPLLVVYVRSPPDSSSMLFWLVLSFIYFYST